MDMQAHRTVVAAPRPSRLAPLASPRAVMWRHRFPGQGALPLALAAVAVALAAVAADWREPAQALLAQHGQPGTERASIVAELDMPFFSFAGITRTRL